MLSIPRPKSCQPAIACSAERREEARRQPSTQAGQISCTPPPAARRGAGNSSRTESEPVEGSLGGTFCAGGHGQSGPGRPLRGHRCGAAPRPRSDRPGRNTTFRSSYARLEAANPEKRRGTVVGKGARKALVPRLGLAAPEFQNDWRGHNVAAGHWGG